LQQKIKMKKIDKINIDGEDIYLRKTFLGWGVVNPIKINGKVNWKNLIAGGSWIKLGILVFIVLVIIFCLYDYANAIKVANECIYRLNQQAIMVNPFF